MEKTDYPLQLYFQPRLVLIEGKCWTFSGKATISNDGATILKLLDIVFPAAKTLVDIAKSQDAEVGDGTTSVVVLAAELMKNARPFIEDGVHPQIVIRAYRKAAQLVSLLAFLRFDVWLLLIKLLLMIRRDQYPI